MAEEFTWNIRAGPSGQIDQRTETNEFGDGYVQEFGVGINNQTESWDVSMTGKFTEGSKITLARQFLDSHRGYKSCLWTPPAGVQGRYRATGYKLAEAGGFYTMSWTFRQVFTP